MKKKMSDLPRDVEEEVLSRIPMASLRPVRSTCKRWNTLSRCDLFAKKHLAHLAEEEEAKEDPLVVMMMDYRVGLMRLNVSNTSNEDVVKPEATLTGLDQIDVCEIIHSDGLLLCVPKDHSRLVVLNPYWGGRPRWIEHTHNHHELEKHLYGLLNRYTYGLGYDSTSRSYKVLRFIDYPPVFFEFKIYDLDSDSWRNIILPPRDWRISIDERGVSIKGNTYWFASAETSYSFLVCFDFTRETFSPPLPLPFEAIHDQDTLSISTTGEQRLVVLFQHCDTLTMEIWVSATIDQPDAVSWNTKVFLSANIKQLFGLPRWQFYPFVCFFIDPEKKVAVVFDKNNHMGFSTHEVAYIFGVDDGSLKRQVVRESSHGDCVSSGCYYVPSLLQLN